MSKNSGHDELISGGFGSGPHSLLRMAGGWGNLGGPGIFMIRTITSGALTSIFVGMSGAFVSALLFDTAGLPFVLCSCAGFVIGAFGFYRDAVRKSIICLERYPRLIQLHLDASFPGERFNTWTRDRLRGSSFTSWRTKSMLTVAWLNALPAIEAIVDNDERKIVDAAGAFGENEEESTIQIEDVKTA